MSVSIQALSTSAIYMQPVDYDWSEGFDERWKIILPRNANPDDDDFCYDDYAPMMNYYYPLPDKPADPERLATLLDRYVPLTLVYFPQENLYAMALTGGGMDLSWEICYAYILAGYLPPFHFCRLPILAGCLPAWKRKVIAACRRTVRIVKRDCQVILKSLQYVSAYYKERGE